MSLFEKLKTSILFPTLQRPGVTRPLLRTSRKNHFWQKNSEYKDAAHNMMRMTRLNSEFRPCSWFRDQGPEATCELRAELRRQERSRLIIGISCGKVGGTRTTLITQIIDHMV